MDNVGTQLSDKMDAEHAVLMQMIQAQFADMLKQSNANTAMVLAKQVATDDQAKKRRGSVHSDADLAEIDRLKEELAQARANNAAIEEAKRHADENDAAGAAAALENSNASEDVKQSATALVAQGEAARANSDFEEAKHLFSEAKAIDPSLAAAWYGYAAALGGRVDGKAFGKAGATADEEMEGYRRAIEIDPNHALTHNNLGILLKNHRKDFDGAEAAYRRAIEIDPNNVYAHYNLCLLYTSPSPRDA